jgi:hypothetical protein
MVRVFAGTRVALQTLFEYLERGDSLNDFLKDYPTVTREHAIALLERVKEALLVRADESAGEAPRPHSILELRGLGKEVWSGVDPDAYVEQERSSWNG